MNNTLNNVEVKVTKAQIQSIKFTYKDDDLPELDVYVNLMLPSGEVLTSLLMSTTHYKKELELGIVSPTVAAIAGELLSKVSSQVKDNINGLQKTITEAISQRK